MVENYDVEHLKYLASNNWPSVFSSLLRHDPDLYDGLHHPCPARCSPNAGGKDRQRFIDPLTGAVLCNQCFNRGNGDGIAWIMHVTNWTFQETIKALADHFGVKPTERKGSYSGKNKNVDPAKDLKFQKWAWGNEGYALDWCELKKPITLTAIKHIGGRFAMYRGKYSVIAFPAWGEDAVRGEAGAKPIGWVLYNSTGEMLPGTYNEATKQSEPVKVKLTKGSTSGIVGNLADIRTAGELWKLEGSTDLLAFLSLADLPPGVVGFTNSDGCGTKPRPFMLEMCRGKKVNVCHDCDEPGQRGAIGGKGEKSGRPIEGWCQAIARVASECRNVVLPFEIEPNHGKDLRDWCSEANNGNGGTFTNLAEMTVKSAVVASDGKENATGSADDDETTVLKADDDPHRLARINIEKYERNNQAVIKFWRNEWYTWKPSRGCYKKIDREELLAKLIRSIEEEYDRLNLVAQAAHKRGQDAGLIQAEEKPPKAHKITKTLVNNVILAMTDLCLIPFSVEPMTWISDRGAKQESRNIVAMKNGLIDIEKLIADAPENEIIREHTADWFSIICLPYNFDAGAECPKWESFLEKNLEMDPERIKLVQEWAGYLLLPDTGFQKFLAIEGEGRNGKSVFCAALRAMLGEENCSSVSLEEFQERFSRTQMIGKLLNIDPDVGELDKVAESFVKKITSGDKIYFDRKGIGGIECNSMARLILSWNNRPRFRDRSNGIWRRMLLVPWNITIQDDEVIPNMDKEWWWEKSGELPGIFIWALQGLIRLRQKKRFTTTEVGKQAIEDYKAETNPARSFLLEFCERSDTSGIRSAILYEAYTRWCDNSRYQPLSEKIFGKEIKRVFSHTERKRSRDGQERYYWHSGIAFNTTEICGKDVSDEMLF